MPSAMEWAPLLPALLEGLVDGGAVAVGALGDLGKGEAQCFLVEGVGAGGFGRQGDHLGPARVEGAAAIGVCAREYPGLAAAVAAGAGGGIQELERSIMDSLGQWTAEGVVLVHGIPGVFQKRFPAVAFQSALVLPVGGSGRDGGAGFFLGRFFFC